MTLVDTNILLDFVTADPIWLAATSRRYRQRMSIGPMKIIDVIFAETSVSFPSAEGCRRFLDVLGVVQDLVSDEALYRAGQAFRRYRRDGGVRKSVLPDFFIGGHASVTGMPILTRDPARYRTYFPDVEIVSP